MIGFDGRTTMIFLERYIQFLNELESISHNHDELTDTDVRERLREMINYYFVWGNPVGVDFSQRYSMFTPEGDEQVFKAVRSFITEAQAWADNNGIPVGQDRHSLLENQEAITAEGNEYDLFLGFSDDVLSEEKPSSDDIFEYSEDDD
jgi:hypothetical protein